MSNATVSIGFKLESGANGIQKLTLNTKDLKAVLGATATEAKKMNDSFINFAALATGLNAVTDTINCLRSTMADLTKAYASQVEVETQLQVNMRNSMGATQEEINSIKELCSAQQALGVIGDEVQLAGAQEMATYLEQKSSLEKLIPVMNDMLAQQYGINATQENAAQIATMLGKTMNGQTGALSRYGYTFDEIQEQILKFGSEAQRAAVLADVISASVGGMNAELAKTDIGKQKQLENTFGDIKETLGGWAQAFMPFITFTSYLTTSTSGMIKLAQSTKIAANCVVGLITNQRVLNSLMIVGAGNKAKAAQALRIYNKAAVGSAASTKALGLAVKGLLISSGIGIAIVALTSALALFASKSDDATCSTNKLNDAQERVRRETERNAELRKKEYESVSNSISQLEIYKAQLKAFSGTKAEENKIVSELNSAYGETMGYFSSVNDWYKALIANSEAYCKQMEIEAETRIVATRIAENKATHDSLVRDINAGKFSKKRKRNAFTKELEASEDGKARGEATRLRYAVKDDEALLKKLYKEKADIQMSIVGARTTPNLSTGTATAMPPKVLTDNPQNIQQLRDNISILEEEKLTATDEQLTRINQQIQAYQEKISELDKQGVGDKWVKEAKSIEDCENNIRILQKLLRETDDEFEAAQYNQQIEEFTERRDKMANAGKSQSDTTDLELIQDAASLRDIQNNIDYYNQKLLDATSPEMAAGLNQQKKHWEELAESIRNAGLETEDTNDLMLDGISAIGGSMKGLGSALELPALDVAGTLAQAIVTMIQGYAAAMAQAGKLGPWVWAGFAAAGLAQLTAIISSVKSAAGFATGGIVPGNSPSGDKLLARVNSGEMILNKSQQSRLFRMLNTPIMTMPDIALPGATSAAIRAHDWDSVMGGVRANLRPAGEPVVVGGTLRASGRDLVCVLSNETRIASKSGRHTNIKI